MKSQAYPAASREPAAAHHPAASRARRGWTLAAWVLALLASILPEILAGELAGRGLPWLNLFRIGLFSALLLVGFVWKPARQLGGFAGVWLVIYAGAEIVARVNFTWPGLVQVHMHYLAARMHALVGAAGAYHFGGGLHELPERRFQRALHGGLALLLLPAEEGGAVIFHCQFIAGHGPLIHMQSPIANGGSSVHSASPRRRFR